MSKWYMLDDNHNVIPGPDVSDKSFKAYSDWLYGINVKTGKPNKIVDQTIAADGCFVSTVFLGLDHSFSMQGPPVVFETLVFKEEGKYAEIEGIRYKTWDKAVEGHKHYLDKHGGPQIIDPPTEGGAREYEEIMSIQALDEERNKA